MLKLKLLLPFKQACMAVDRARRDGDATARALTLQAAEAAEQVATAREDKRSVEATASELGYKLAQAERRLDEEASAATQARAHAKGLADRLEAAETRARESEALVAEHERAAKGWEERLLEADEALSLADSRAQVRCSTTSRSRRQNAHDARGDAGLGDRQRKDRDRACADVTPATSASSSTATRPTCMCSSLGLSQALQQQLAAAETDKQKLRDTMMQTEDLIVRARREHAKELDDVKTDAEKQVLDLEARVQEHRLSVRRRMPLTIVFRRICICVRRMAAVQAVPDAHLSRQTQNPRASCRRYAGRARALAARARRKRPA